MAHDVARRMLFRSDQSATDLARRIAEELRAQPSAEFLRALALSFDPGRKKPVWRAIMQLGRTGRPSRRHDQLGRELASAIDNDGEKYEAAIAAGMAKYKVKRSVATKALAGEREARALYEMVVRETK